MTEDIKKACEVMQEGGNPLSDRYYLGDRLRCDQRGCRTACVRVKEKSRQ